MKKQDIIQDDIRTMNFLGEVVENKDSTGNGRIKVKVFGKFDELKTEDIPWAHPNNMISGGSISGSGFYSIPKIGSIVNVYFDNGNIYSPIYTSLNNISDDLITEIGEDYDMFHSIIYDTEIENGFKIYYSPNQEKGFFINLKNTIINIKNNNDLIITNPNKDTITIKNDGTLDITNSKSITINTKEVTINSNDKIEINTKNAIVNASDKTEINTKFAKINSGKIELGKNALEKLILGNKFLIWLNTNVIAKYMTHTHTGNLGSVTSPPLNVIPNMGTDLLSNVSKTE